MWVDPAVKAAKRFFYTMDATKTSKEHRKLLAELDAELVASTDRLMEQIKNLAVDKPEIIIKSTPITPSEA